MKQPVDIAAEIIDELTGRSGFDGFWDSVDDETRNEIMTTLTSIIAEGQQSSPQAPICRLTMAEWGAAGISLYAPGLPPGEHDLYCEPEAVAPYLRAHQPGAKHA